MPRPVRRPRALEYQIFRARDALDAGLLTPTELRGSGWRRVLRGVYADSRLEFDHELRWLVKPDELATLHAARSLLGSRGAGTAGRVFDLADGRSGSPQESRLRVRLMLAGLPRPVCQYEVVLASGLVLHPDLGWPEFKVALEYDGAYHAEPGRLHIDRRRLNQLVTAGWIVLHATSVRMRSDFGGIVRELRTALESRGAKLR